MKPSNHQSSTGLPPAPQPGKELSPNKLPCCPGPFDSSSESLSTYQCPDWFRDAKFGIWAHWGPQAVPGHGDWYARGMYIPEDRHQAWHLEHYGHPSRFGYKDIIPLWQAERWDPDRLMARFKQAGARYFMSMGTHHDNFFLWPSKLHRWNAAAMGPRRDVVGEWQAAALKHGLRFGVSEHLGASFTWFQTSHGCDPAGPHAGVPYDGNDPANQDLYHRPAAPDDTAWYTTDPEFQKHWYACVKELLDLYHPDIVYTDGGIPFGEIGRTLVAHLYNQSVQDHGGRNEAVYNHKDIGSGEYLATAGVPDQERGVKPGISPLPWQTDTSIGDWFYNRDWHYRPASWTIHLLCDVVSKNGNLLLNVVQRPDGSLEPEVEQLLEELGAWLAVHGEAIYGTRPWQVYGEGKVKARGGHFREDFAYTAQDIRFTTREGVLYAIALGCPADGTMLVRSLASGPGQGRVTGVALLGHDGPVVWEHSPEGLRVHLPRALPSRIACALRISGDNLLAMPVPEEDVVIPVLVADAAGAYLLDAEHCAAHGERLGLETRDGVQNIAYWQDPAEWVSWKLDVARPGRFLATAVCAADAKAQRIGLAAGESGCQSGTIPAEGWGAFNTVSLGELTVPAGLQQLELRPLAEGWKGINLRSVQLQPIG